MTDSPSPDPDPPRTATLGAARDHARAQVRTAGRGVSVPAASGDLPPDVDPDAALWREVVPGGNYASRRLPRDSVLRLADPGGDTCVQLVVHRAEHPVERLCVADTVKVQWQAYLGEGSMLLSDMGRSLMTFVADTSGRHDALCGGSSEALHRRRFGAGEAWSPTPASRPLMLLAMAKAGLGRRDLPPVVNLFKGVRVDGDGSLVFEGSPRPGAAVELRAEVDVLVTLTVTPHVLDPRPAYEVGEVEVTAWRSGRGEPDRWRDTTPERARALDNTEELLRSGAR